MVEADSTQRDRETMAAHTAPIRLGIIGTGIAAQHLHWPALQHSEHEFQVMALCNRTREKAEALATLIGTQPRITTDYRELLSWDDVDAVDIATPIALNEQVTIDALRAGKHVILEKPIAGSVEAGERVVAEAQRHPDLVLLVAENLRYETRFSEARRLLDSGHIGRPVMIHADVLAPIAPESPYAATSWRQKPEHLGGYLSDGGVHQVAALHMLAGTIVAVQGLVTGFRPDMDPTDTLLANLLFASGMVGHLTYSLGVSRQEDAPIRIWGTEGSLAIHGDRIDMLAGTREESVPIPSTPNGYDLEFRDFREAIMEHRQPRVSPQDALDDLRVIDAAMRSSRDGIVVHLERP
jgi:predicted dehydrogenase